MLDDYEQGKRMWESDDHIWWQFVLLLPFLIMVVPILLFGDWLNRRRVS